MIRHYLLTALANMKAAPFTTAAKVLTLALGLAAVVAISAILTYWRSGDGQVTPPGAVAVVTSMEQHGSDFRMRDAPVTLPLLATYMREDIPELERVVRFNPRPDIATDTGERTVVLQGANADPGFFDIFQFEFVAGDRRTAMDNPDGVILSQEAAQRLFGGGPALGRPLVLGGARNVTVTGVFKEIPKPTHFGSTPFTAAFDYISVMVPPPPGPEEWNGLSGSTYALMPQDGSITRAQLDQRLADLIERRMPPEDKAEGTMTMRAVDVGEITELSLNLMISGASGGFASLATLLFVLGAVVLGVAALNYANLATAQAVARARELGMRRVLGAGRWGILVQSWVEATLSVAAALTLTAVLLWAAAPVIAAQAGVDLVAAIARDPSALAGIAAVAVLLALLSGLYPAFVAARARPVEALRDGKARAGPRRIAGVLIGLQFGCASALLIAMIVVAMQNAHLRGLVLNAADDPVLILPPGSRSGIAYETLREGLSSSAPVKAVSRIGGNEPWSFGEGLTDVKRAPGDEAVEHVATELRVGFDYFEAFDQPVLAGRAHEEGRDQTFVGQGVQQLVIDRAFAEELGFSSPQAAVGQRVYDDDTDPMEIMGVVENRAHMVRSEAKGGTVYRLQSDSTDPDDVPLVRLDSANVEAGVAAVRGVFEELAPNAPFDARFEDELFEAAFRGQERTALLFLALASVAFAISAMGLFGMATHATQRRRHEIGVRKTLGSSVRQVVVLLLAEFSRPVFIANLIAWPVGYLAAKAYLAGFANRIDLTFWPFALSMAITLAIAWLAVGGQTLRAASVRPAEVLRNA